MGLRRWIRVKVRNINPKHLDAEAKVDADTRVTTIALPVLCTGELKIYPKLLISQSKFSGHKIYFEISVV